MLRLYLKMIDISTKSDKKYLSYKCHIRKFLTNCEYTKVKMNKKTTLVAFATENEKF